MNVKLGCNLTSCYLMKRSGIIFFVVVCNKTGRRILNGNGVSSCGKKNRKEEGGVKLAQYLNNAFNHLYS